jgi:hypothetical protein
MEKIMRHKRKETVEENYSSDRGEFYVHMQVVNNKVQYASLGKRHDIAVVSAHYAKDVQAFIDVRDLLNELISLINDLDLEWERKK